MRLDELITGDRRRFRHPLAPPGSVRVHDARIGLRERQEVQPEMLGAVARPVVQEHVAVGYQLEQPCPIGGLLVVELHDRLAMIVREVRRAA